jgi:transcriptional regulator with XRE-family HTH domain
MVDKQEFGEKIKQIRESKNISVRQAAIKADMSHSYLSQIENGLREIPSKKVLIKMAKGLRMTETEIFKIAGFIPDDGNDIKEVDLKHPEHNILTYGGKPISDDDWNIIKRILESGQSE